MKWLSKFIVGLGLCGCLLLVLGLVGRQQSQRPATGVHYLAGDAALTPVATATSEAPAAAPIESSGWASPTPMPNHGVYLAAPNQQSVAASSLNPVALTPLAAGEIYTNVWVYAVTGRSLVATAWI